MLAAQKLQPLGFSFLSPSVTAGRLVISGTTKGAILRAHNGEVGFEFLILML